VKPTDLATLAEQREGNLAEVPFGAVLLAHALERRTLALEIQRRQIRKTILLEHGVPVECRSNLLRETLGEFLVSEGQITAFQCRESLAEAAARGLRIGAVLIEKGFLDPLDLHRVVQRNFGHKLLECFAWTNGAYRVFPELPETRSTTPVNVPRLVFNGLTRFTPPEQMFAWIGPLMRRPLALHPDPPVALAHLRLSAQQRQIVTRLRQTRYARDLLRQCTLPRDDVLCTLAALVVMGLVVIRKLEVDRDPLKAEIEADLAEAVESEPAAEPAAEPERGEQSPLLETETVGVSAAEAHRFRNEIAAEHMTHRKKDASELLGITADTSDAEVRRRYVELTERYAPARFAAPALRGIRPMADDLLRATVNAYRDVSNRQMRDVGLAPRRWNRTPFAESEHPTGCERRTQERSLGAEDQLANEIPTGDLPESAGAESADGVESAYALFRASPEEGERALEILASVDSVGARLYAAEICHSLGDLATARDHFRRGCALWAEGTNRAEGELDPEAASPCPEES